MHKEIESKDNKLFKKIKSLNKSNYRKRYGLYLVEGKKMLAEAINSKIPIEFVIVRTSFKSMDFDKYDFEVIVLNDSLFDDITTMKNDEGVITVCKITKDKAFNLEENFLILDGLRDPGNMGTIIRTAESFGYRNILLVNNCVDIYNSKVLRASMGSIFRVNIIISTLGDILELKKSHLLIGMTLDDNSKDIYSMTDIQKHAIIIGNEANGIDYKIKELIDLKLIIPIAKNVESLNAAIAASITIFYFNLINMEKEKKASNSF